MPTKQGFRLGPSKFTIDLHRWGTTAAAPPPFRPGEPALCGSHPLVTPAHIIVD